jgi:hypothetical protein
VAYLNSDEQYLPGGLRAVVNYFDSHPGVDLLFADVVVVDANGGFICYRKVQLPTKYHVMVSHLPTLTSSMFFRRKLLDQGLFFDTRWRDVGDADWVLRNLKIGTKIGLLRQYISIFTETGGNMSVSANAKREKKELFDAAPAWARRLAPLIVAQHRARRWLGGAYRQDPFDYSIYTKESPEKRKTFHVARPTFLWKDRL